MEKYKAQGMLDADAERMANYEILRNTKGVDVAEAYLRNEKKILEGNSSSIDNVTKHIKDTGKLPDNYITKSEAKNLGWSPKKGNLDSIAPGKAIGGDIYQNRSGALPVADGRTYYEADLNYNGGYRGQDRLIYSNDGLFFTTSDHYQTFTQIGKGDNK